MKPEHVKHKIPDYLANALGDRERQEVKDHLTHCRECLLELEQYETLDLLLKNEEVTEPSARLGNKFDEMLQKEISETPKEKSFFDYKSLLKIAAAVTLLILSFQTGRLMEQDSPGEGVVESTGIEANEERLAMLSLMINESASKRIQGVNYFEDFSELDDEILKVLINKMHYDENTNVRLAAVEALSKFDSSDEVRKNLVSALKTERDPVIQINLIQTLVKIQEKEAVEPLKNLLQNEETRPFVKEQIEALLPSII